MKKLKILDIDLDFFLNKKYTAFNETYHRLDPALYLPWQSQKVVDYLETNCKLLKHQKVPGKYFTHHDEAFYFLRRLQEQNAFTLNFAIDHIDAHADLGLGDSSYDYISTELLFKQPLHRPYPAKTEGRDQLNKGNFLLFMIACRWITNLNYVNRTEWMGDIPPFCLKDFDIKSNIIQLKKYSKSQMKKIIYGKFIETAKSINPIALEPEVPFNAIDHNAFFADSVYDYIFLTQSPNYTPASSDKLVPVIQKYMDLL